MIEIMYHHNYYYGDSLIKHTVDPWYPRAYGSKETAVEEKNPKCSGRIDFKCN
jgi:hypothetical protein